jgi:DNA-binding response OmpR family regulator
MARTVLIVEDCEEIAALEIALATLDGMNVIAVANGREALDFLNRESLEVAAIITDLHLPYVDGFELIKTLRAHCRYSHLPILVVSGDGQPDTPEKLRNLGADAFFSKPYSPAEIRHKLKALLNAS